MIVFPDSCQDEPIAPQEQQSVTKVTKAVLKMSPGSRFITDAQDVQGYAPALLVFEVEIWIA